MTPVKPSPATMYFWQTTKTSTGGATASTIAAISWSCGACVASWASATLMGCFSGSVMATSGQMKSFQECITASRLITASTGLLMGSTILVSSCRVLAPSTRAASNSSFGRASKNCLASSTVKAFVPAGSQIAQ